MKQKSSLTAGGVPPREWFLLFLAAMMGLPHAQADETRESEELGIYRISDIIRKSDDRSVSLCQREPGEGSDPRSGAEECGREVRVIRRADQVMVVEASRGRKRSGTSIKTFQMVSGILRRHCSSLAHIRGGKGQIFESDLCRAVKVEDPGRQGEQVYYFSQDNSAGSAAQAYADSVVAGAMTGIPVGTGLEVKVIIPAGDGVPQRLTIEKTLNGTVLFIPVTLQTEFILERVGD